MGWFRQRTKAWSPLGLLAVQLVVVSAPLAQPAAAQSNPLDHASWLAGCWEARTGGRVTMEMWVPPAGGMMIGGSRTTMGDTTREFEHLRLVVKDGRLIYTAIPSGQRETAFTSTAVSDTLLVFENLQHDFPQRIIYRRRGADSMVARVEGPAADDTTRGFTTSMRRAICTAPDQQQTLAHDEGMNSTEVCMLALPILRDLYAHMEWADAQVWQAVLVLNGPGSDAFLHERLLHVHDVQRAYLHVWTGRPLTLRGAGELTGSGELLEWARPYYGEVGRIFDELDDEALAQPLVVPWAAEIGRYLGRDIASPTLAETILQVASHSTYHRGQLNTRLRQLGAEPPLVDYVAWIWFDRPAADWPPRSIAVDG